MYMKNGQQNSATKSPAMVQGSNPSRTLLAKNMNRQSNQFQGQKASPSPISSSKPLPNYNQTQYRQNQQDLQSMKKNEISDDRLKTPTQVKDLPKSGSDDDIIEIHVNVNDENKNFKCPKKLLFQEMKYFEIHAKDCCGDDLDISVQCDVQIFEWLMRYIKNKNNPPQLTIKNVISILISSNYLKMDRLEKECL